MSSGAKVAFMAVLVAMVATTAESGVSCKLVVNSLTPCTTYLIRGGKVATKCCNGVKLLYKDANTKTDRQMACRCMEQAAKLLPAIKLKYANDLPQKCGVDVPYKITPTFDCSTVK